MNRKEIKAIAKVQFKQRYWFMVGFNIVGMLLLVAAAYTGVGAIAAVPIIEASIAFGNLKRFRGEEDLNMGTLFEGFKKYGHVLGGMWWMYLFIYLWSLLFIVPGIIKSIAYSMTPYILMDQPEIGAKEALKLSMQMTDGHKGQIFVMYLSFIGWQLLNGITYGILGIFYVNPYYSCSLAGIYESLKNDGVLPTVEA